MDTEKTHSSSKSWQENIHVCGLIYFLALVTILLQGCSGVSSKTASATDNQQRSVYTAPVTNSSNNNSTGTQNCQYSEIGSVYDSSASQLESGDMSTSYRQRLADLVSVSLSPDSLGQVSGVYGAATGVQLRLKLRFTSSGQIIPGDSFLEMTINDSYVGQSDEAGNLIEPYIIYIESVKSGTFNASSKQLQVTFADSYGEISLQGRVQNEDLQGTLSFRNFTSYDNSEAKSGVLGEFTIPACSIGK